MTDVRLALCAWKVKKTTEIQDEMAAEGRTSELLWARDCKMLLDLLHAAERQRDKATAALANVKEAADDVLAELGKCPDYETAMVAASKLCGTLQFISQHVATLATDKST